MSRYCINPSTLSGVIEAPPSKSHTLRAILFATLAEGKSQIKSYLSSPDIESMINACRQLGANITCDKDSIIIDGVGGKPSFPEDVIDAGNSGQVLRFVGAVAALTDGFVVITGDHSVKNNRPVKPLLAGLSCLGAHCQSLGKNNHAPIVIKGPIQSGTAELSGEDSQPVSGLLIAAAFLDGRSRIKVSNPGELPWIGLTLDWFDKLGIQYTNDNFNEYVIEGNAKISGFAYTVPGDFSSIAYPVVGAIITNSEITIKNIDMSDPQGDKYLIDLLIDMGAKIDIDRENRKLTVKKDHKLKGRAIDVNRFIDGITILALVGCYAEGSTRIYNGAIARKKECDRIASIVTELKKMGADIQAFDDGLQVSSSSLQGTQLKTYDDHRMAMSLAIAAMGASGQSTIDNIDCVSKSYQDFYQDMKQLGCNIEIVG